MGQPGANAVLAIKKVSLGARAQSFVLDFPAPAPAEGAASETVKAKLLFMSDSYMGADQEFAFDLVVGAAKV